MALALLTGMLWPSLSITLLLLVLAGFGGALAPYVPFAQWIFALHNLPGTLSVGVGILYVSIWTALSGITVLWVSNRSRL